jgi:hypothetical protein
MRGRRSDIDPDRRQLDIVGGPSDLVDRDVVGADMKVLEFEIVHRRWWQIMIWCGFWI